MTSIRVIDDAGDTHILDLYEDIVPKASYQFKDIRQPSFVRAPFTDTFRVPATDNNIRFFGPLYDPTSSTSYVTKTKKKAFIEIETIPVFSGFLRLSKAIVQQGKFKEFEVSLFGDVVTLAKDLGEKLLSDLDFSGLDHDLTYANVLSSWTLGLLSGNVVYGMADYGARFGCLSTSFRDITNPDNALLADHLKPAVRLRAIIDAAFLAAGWTYESTHIDSTDFGKLYLPWVNHAGERMLLPGDAVLEKLFCITPNETEAEILTGIQIVDRESASSAAEILLQRGVENVVITMGGRGALLHNADETYYEKAARVTVVDTTAAGDTFNGVLAAMIAEGQSLKEAVRFAVAAATRSVQTAGAIASIPHRVDFM